MKDLILAKWNDILNILENEHGISHIMIHTWIEPLKIYSVEDNKVYFTLDEDYGQRGVEFLKRKLFDISESSFRTIQFRLYSHSRVR